MNRTVWETTLPTGQKLQIVHGDLTDERVDAIVNAANPYLRHGGGVAGVIVRRGGAQIQEESNAWVRRHGPVTHHAPAHTRAGNLACRYIIHAVGPVWGEGDEDAKLAAAIAGALRCADELALSSIALPAISTGIFGFPLPRAAEVILSALLDYFAQNRVSGLQQTRLVLLDQSAVDLFVSIWKARLEQSNGQSDQDEETVG